jgi:hypothetical protein
VFSHTATAIPFTYSFSGNCAASVPISTFMCLRAIYIVPGSVHIFPPAEKADPSWEYIIRSQTHECGNWDCMRPRYFFSGNICFNFSAFCFCSALCRSVGMGRGEEMESWEESSNCVCARVGYNLLCACHGLFVVYKKMNTTGCLSWVLLAVTVTGALFIHYSVRTYP